MQINLYCDFTKTKTGPTQAPIFFSGANKAVNLVVEVQRDIFQCKKTLGLRRIPLNWVKWLLFLSAEEDEV